MVSEQAKVVELIMDALIDASAYSEKHVEKVRFCVRYYLKANKAINVSLPSPAISNSVY